MILRTSSNKTINPSFNMFKFTLRRNLGGLLLITACALLISPGYSLMKIRETVENMGYSSYDVGYFIRLMFYCGTFAGCAISVIFNIINFSFLYQKRSVDVFLSFPLTRFEMISSRFFAGLVLSIIPVTVGYLGLLGILLFYPPAVGSIGTLSVYLLYSLLSILICSAFSLIFLVCAGNAFDFILSFFGINIGIIGISLMVSYTLQQTVYGYDESGSENFILKYGSPFSFIIRSIKNYLDNPSGKAVELFVIKAIILSVIFYVIACALFYRRKSEKSGESYAFRFIYYASSIVYSVCGAFIIGILFESEVATLKFVITAVLGALIFCIAYGAISNRGFKTVKKSALLGIISSLMIISVILGGHFDIFGVVKKVPAKEDIKSASINFSGLNIEIKDFDIVTSLHKEITLDKNIERLSQHNDGDIRDTIDINYKLKSGNKLFRSYNFVKNAMEDKLLSFYRSSDFKNAVEETATRNSAVGAVIDINGDNLIIKTEDYKAFVKAYFSDIESADKSLVTSDELFITVQENADYRDYNKNYYFSLPVSDEFTQTENLLNEFVLKYGFNNSDDSVVSGS